MELRITEIVDRAFNLDDHPATHVVWHSPSMQWTAISGSWRKHNAQVLADVRSAVAAILDDDGGIVTGGALGVDYFATAPINLWHSM